MLRWLFCDVLKAIQMLSPFHHKAQCALIRPAKHSMRGFADQPFWYHNFMKGKQPVVIYLFHKAKGAPHINLENKILNNRLFTFIGTCFRLY